MTGPLRFDLPHTAFPFTVQFYRLDDPDGLRPVHRIEVTEPYTHIEVPPLSREHGPVWVRMRYADGRESVYGK